jgi:6-phosphogluconolactonase
MSRTVFVASDQDSLWRVLDRYILDRLGAVRQTGRPGLLISGGTTFLPWLERFGDPDADVFLTDERMVPAGSAADTTAMLWREWFGRLATPKSRFLPITRHADAALTAAAYEATLHQWEQGGGVWGVAVLGLGEDGHTASLFPGQQSRWEHSEALCIPAQAEQSPFVPRITVTPTLLRRVPTQLIVARGTAKAAVVRRWLVEDDMTLPVSRLSGEAEQIVFLDRDAASRLDATQYQPLTPLKSDPALD